MLIVQSGMKCRAYTHYLEFHLLVAVRGKPFPPSLCLHWSIFTHFPAPLFLRPWKSSWTTPSWYCELQSVRMKVIRKSWTCLNNWTTTTLDYEFLCLFFCSRQLFNSCKFGSSNLGQNGFLTLGRQIPRVARLYVECGNCSFFTLAKLIWFG